MPPGTSGGGGWCPLHLAPAAGGVEAWVIVAVLILLLHLKGVTLVMAIHPAGLGGLMKIN